MKYRKTWDTFECTECNSLLIVEKHPAFVEAKLIHSSQVKKDFQFECAQFGGQTEDLWHTPYDEQH